jgi:hypothetical protein
MRRTTALFALLLAAPAAASAQVVLTFEGIGPSYPFANDQSIGDFYNGGTSGFGTTGTDYGISFGSNALAVCLNSTDIFCSSASRGGFGDPTSANSALFWTSGTETFMNVAAGFSTGFSFFYTARNQGGSVLVYDDLNGTGNILATIILPTTLGTCDPAYFAPFCPFVAAGSTFNGIAKSVAWGGVADQIAFDDVTLGSDTPGNPSDVVPEPATMTLLATGLAGMAAARKRRKTA